jgi:tRNA (guanine-N7-)-methyltransferase
MKPNDLKRPYSFAERHPFLEDHIFHIPIYYDSYATFSLPPLREYFRNDQPVNVEFCSGNGDWIIEKATTQGEINWIAVERRFDRVRKIWSKLKNHQLSNLLIVYGEAFTFAHHYLLSNTIESVFINFPDPWPKVKHAKNRLLQPLFLKELARVLVAHGCLTFVTDDHPYMQQTISLLIKNSFFSPCFPVPHHVEDLPNYGKSWFEALWRNKGKKILFARFCKTSSL